MAIARVQASGVADNQAKAYGSDNTAGNLLVLVASAGADITGVTDTAGNTWVKAVDVAGTNFLDIWYVLSCLAGANTVTAANGFGNFACHTWVAEYSASGAWSLDKTAGRNESSVTDVVDSGATATTTAADELLVGAVENQASRTMTWTSPSTEQYDNAAGGVGRAMSAADEIVSATGTYSAAGTLSSATVDFNAAIATFKAAVGSSASAAPLHLCGGGLCNTGLVGRGLCF